MGDRAGLGGVGWRWRPAGEHGGAVVQHAGGAGGTERVRRLAALAVAADGDAAALVAVRFWLARGLPASAWRFGLALAMIGLSVVGNALEHRLAGGGVRLRRRPEGQYVVVSCSSDMPKQ